MAYNQMFTPIWQLFNNNGQPLTGGSIWFFDNTDHNLPKNVYQDDSGTPWPNPIILNAAGFQPMNAGLFGSGSYYIEVHLTSDRSSQLIFSQENYIPPEPASVTPVVPSTDIQNFILNPQMSLYGQSYNTTGVSVPSSILNLAPGGWVFVKNNTTAIDLIEFPSFDPGQTDVPANPNVYFNYVCNGIGTGENLKYLGYRFNNYSSFGLDAGSGVNTLSGQNVTLQFEGISLSNSTLTVSVYQYFGANGSTAVLTPVSGFNLTSEWSTASTLGKPFTAQFLIPSIAGKTIDPNGGDYLEIRFNMPLNNACNIGLTNFGLQDVSTFIAFQPNPINDLQSQLQGLQFPTLTTQSQVYQDGCYDLGLLQGQVQFGLIPRAGRIIYWPVNTVPTYGLTCNGFPFYQSQHYNLAQVLWDTNQNKLPWGVGPDGFTTTLSTATITATCFSNGTVVSGTAGNSPFTFTQTNNGGPSAQGVATILCTAATTLPTTGTAPAIYFLMNSPNIDYYFYMSYNNLTPDPGLSVTALNGKKGVKIIYTGTETDVQIAALVQLQINLAQIRVPDFRGLFIRMWAQGVASVLSEYTNVLIISEGNDSGITFAISGFDDMGNAISENLTGANVGTATSAKKYQGIVSIIPSNNTASNVGIGDVNNGNGLCFSQVGTSATPLMLDGPYQRDPDYLTRTTLYFGGGIGDNVGSNQQSQNLAHTHQYETGGGGAGNYGNGDSTTGGSFPSLAIKLSGGNQSNPHNVYANAIILY